MLDKFFEFIFSLPLLRKLKPLYERQKGIILYIFFGGLTTVVSFVVFWFFVHIIPFDPLVANTISWVISVAFAFFTNRVWVFNSPTHSARAFFKQLFMFYVGRLFSFAVEQLMIFVFINKLGFNDLIIKLIATIIVLILNYIISKVIVFRTKRTEE